MISKVFDGHSFYHACRYMCNKPGAEVLATEGVRGHNFKLMADDFLLQAELRPTKTQACFHSVLSFYPGENPDNATMVEIGKKYLAGIGIVNTQFAITKHTDKDHLHLHIMANMIDSNGKSITDSMIGRRGKKVAQQLTQEYKLIPATEKNLQLTHLEALGRSEANRYKIYIAILESLPHCGSMEELEQRLLRQGIETLYKYKGQTQERQGVSFKMGVDCFKGSKVDRKFSLGNLEKTISLQQNQVAEQSAKVTNMPDQRTIPRKIDSENQPIVSGVKLANHAAEGVGNILEELLKVEYNPNGLPYELLKEARKKKKKKRRP
jgi:hypothetical protein